MSSDRTNLNKALILICFLAFLNLGRAQDSEQNEYQKENYQFKGPANDSSMPPLPDPSLAGTYGPIKVKIDQIEPEAGPTSGDTRVLVRGSPFADMQLYFPTPMCKFGHDDMIVPAVYVLCTSQRTIEEREARHREKNDTCLQCDNSPAANKPEIVSFTVSLTGDFSDVGNSVPFRYYPPSRVFAIYPRYGPKDGETVVQVWGENFLNFDTNTRCAFGTKSVVATFINSNYMICVSPFSDVVEKPIPFTVSLNNQQNSKDTLFFWYYSWHAITELVPDRGPDQGGTKVLLKGRNFNPFKDENIDNANDTFCMFENLAKVPVTVINSTKAICYSPPSYILRSAIVEITLNNQQYTDDNNIFYYYRPPYLFDATPREAPKKGGTRVIAIGSNFRNTGNISCKFNETIVPGYFISTSEIECFTPAFEHSGYIPFSIAVEGDMFSPSIQFLIYEPPVFDMIGPLIGPDCGDTEITIQGKNFLDMGHDKAFCIFNKTIYMSATVMDDTTMKCVSPSLINSQGYSMMTNHLLNFVIDVTIDGGKTFAEPGPNYLEGNEVELVYGNQQEPQQEEAPEEGQEPEYRPEQTQEQVPKPESKPEEQPEKESVPESQPTPTPEEQTQQPSEEGQPETQPGEQPEQEPESEYPANQPQPQPGAETEQGPGYDQTKPQPGFEPESVNVPQSEQPITKPSYETENVTSPEYGQPKPAPGTQPEQEQPGTVKPIPGSIYGPQPDQAPVNRPVPETGNRRGSMIKFLYYKQPVLAEIVPNRGPVEGGTLVKILGKGFCQDYLVCDPIVRFGPIEVKPINISQLDNTTYTNSLNLTETEIQQMRTSADESKRMADEEKQAGKFGDDSAPEPAQTQPTQQLPGDQNGTQVKLPGSKGEEYQPDESDLDIKRQERKRSGQKRPIIIETNDTAIWVKAPRVFVPDAVVIAVAMNRLQFTRDITIHVRDEENTYEYYQKPIISNFLPKSGPTVGGTPMEIDGIGFTPFKDKYGRPDKQKNNMYVRFVDPVTGKIIGKASAVEEDLSDDSATWITSRLPPNTPAALMQVSLNGQDWDDVPQAGKAYSFSSYDPPHITKLLPSFGHVKDKNDAYMLIEGTNFKCPDAECSELTVRFGEPDYGIFVKGELINSTFVKVKIPKYTKPDVLRVELTVNGKDYTNDHKTYGYFDPFVLSIEPNLISVEGTTVVRIRGFGFVNTSEIQSQFSSSNSNLNLLCGGKPCIKKARYIDKYTIETETFAQAMMMYQETETNVLWDPISVDASVHENDFTDNEVYVYYYEEPEYKEILQEESPANIENQIFVRADFKKNPIERLRKYSNFTCRFRSEDGKVKYTRASIERYPLEQGNPNAIQCKSPKWNLRGKALEKVTMDIAVNGQDFRGGFEFYFTQELILHRTVPMSGPVQGGTKTRLVGSGFKPPKSAVSAKWGVLSTDIIPKSLVEDYIYYKLQFENMIEGSEELKGYIYEAAQFARVDTILEEGLSYHAVYMNPPQLINWTQTHGGPYYVEVGKNIEIQYHTTTNVTVKIKQQSQNVTNSTSVDTYQTTEQDVIKQWNYYEYEPSSVEYYYYKDCIVKDMQPHSGLLAGGTPISVVGAWFKYMPEYGVVPHCKFGSKIVRAQFDSTVRIVCKAPPGEELGTQLSFSVSLNGVDWIDTGFKFTYYEQPNLSYITPTSGPESGGTMVYIFGTNFTNVSNPNEFNCRFTPLSLPIPPKKMPGVYINSTTIMCASPGGWGQGDAVKLQVTFNGGEYDDNNFIFTFFSVTRAFPRSGPADGEGGDIIIEGIGFRNDTNPLCKINNTIYTPTSVTWRQIRCPVPRAQGGEKFFGNVPLSVSPNGMDWNNFVGGFQYYPQPIVEEIYPKQGPSVGIGIINFYGDGFRDDYNLVDLACKIGDSVGKAVYVSPKHIKCVIQDMELVNEGDFLPAQLALNRYSWTNVTNSSMFLPYGIEQIYPNSGPTTGVTDIIVQGKGFVDEEGNTARCRFGTPANYAIVDAQILSYERVVCKAPAEFKLIPPQAFPEDVPFSIAFTSDEYDPWTETSHKFRFYEQPMIVNCEPCEVEAGTISEILVWADENSQFSEPVPVMKLVDQDTQGSQTSIGSSIGGITCQFGRFGETQAIFINETVIKCVTPAIEDDPDSIYRETVKLTVALNGQDHQEEFSQVDFTFIGTGTYLVFWPFIIGALLVGLLVVALVVCCATIFQKMSLDDMLAQKGHVGGNEGLPHVFNVGNGVMVPRGRADWNAERSSVDMLERASGQQFYQ